MVTHPRTADDESGSADVVAVVLLLGVVAVASVGILAVAASTQEQTSERLGIQQAETGLLELADDSRSLVHGASRNGEVDLGLVGVGERSSVGVPDRGRIVVTREDGTTVLDRTLGAVEYQSDGGTVAFQGGGVWRGTGAASRPVSTPALDYRGRTLRLDLVAVEGPDALGSTSLELDDRNADRTRSGRLEDLNGVVRITVRSRYYGGWAEYFRETFDDASVVVDHGQRRVTVHLGRFGGGRTIENVLTARAGDVEISTGNSVVEGDIAREGTVTVDAASQHYGGVTTTPDDRALDRYVERATALARERSVPQLGTADEIDDPGRHLVDGDLDLGPGEELTVDLSRGNVTLIVDGNVTVEGGTLRVENPGTNRRLRILTTGDLAMKNGEALVDPRSTVSARHLQVFGTSDTQVGMVGGNTYFEGVVYAPRETAVPGENTAALTPSSQCDLNGGEADVCIATGNTAVEGAIHAGPAVVKQSTTVRYDPGLDGYRVRISPGMAGMDSLEHLHVALRPVTVDDD